MDRQASHQLQELKTVCRQLAAARQRVEELERRRDALIKQARAEGVTGAALARHASISPGRVTQISGTNHN